jgi:hypothetical protein
MFNRLIVQILKTKSFERGCKGCMVLRQLTLKHAVYFKLI